MAFEHRTEQIRAFFEDDDDYSTDTDRQTELGSVLEEGDQPVGTEQTDTETDSETGSTDNKMAEGS